jgi:hypothetical protein
MSFNGSGTFVINTAGQPVVSGTVISSTAFNALTADLATGLSTCITKDGQTTPTANIPMGNNKITGLAVGTAATDAANLSQAQSTASKLITVSGTDTVTGTLSPTLAAYAAGQMFYWVAAGTNTGAVTLNIDSLGAKAVTRDGSTALAAGDIRSGEVVVVVYDGTRFQVVSQINSAGDATFANVSITSALNVGGVATFTSNPVLSGGTANGVLYLNGSKAATSGSALTFSGTVFGVNGSAADGIARITGGASNFGGSLQFYADIGGGGNYYRAFINGINESGSGSALTFSTTTSGNSDPGEKMRIDRSGNVGIGTSSPGKKLDVNGEARITTGLTVTAATSSLYTTDGTLSNYGTSNGVYLNGHASGWLDLQASGSQATKITLYGQSEASLPNTIVFKTNSAERMRLDSSGNLGLGVTPSAWSGRAIQVLDLASWSATGAGNTSSALTHNAFWDGTNWKYITGSVGATRYQMTGANAGSTHSWSVSAGGTAGNAITFTQAMTLDASGNLGVGETNPSAYSSKMVVVNSSSGAATNGAYFVNGNTAANTEIAINLMPSNATTRVGVISAIQDGSQNISLKFSTSAAASPVERARITAGGYGKFSNDGTYAGGSTGTAHEFNNNADNSTLQVFATSSVLTNDALYIQASRNTTNNTFYAIGYYNSGASAYKFRVADSGNVTNTNGSYGTISDAKMKTDIVDAGSQWDDLKAVRFRKFKMKDDPAGLVQLGVVAQELEQTSPGLVDEHTDRDAEGNDLGTTTKSVKTSVLLMKAAVALQEAMARIEQLEADVAALKGA